jgi:hypothetical protein
MNEIDKLAQFIMREIPGEPSQNQGAADTAIRLLRATPTPRDTVAPAAGLAWTLPDLVWPTRAEIAEIIFEESASTRSDAEDAAKRIKAAFVAAYDAQRAALSSPSPAPAGLRDVLAKWYNDRIYPGTEWKREDFTYSAADELIAILAAQPGAAAPAAEDAGREDHPQGPARPIKLRTIYTESTGKYDYVLIDSYPIGGGIWTGPRVIAKEIEFRIRAFEATAPEAKGEGGAEPTYPCEDCGKPRTKAEGGTTFTVCDECWDRHYGKAGSGSRSAHRAGDGQIQEAARAALDAINASLQGFPPISGQEITDIRNNLAAALEASGSEPAKRSGAEQVPPLPPQSNVGTPNHLVDPHGMDEAGNEGER